VLIHNLDERLADQLVAAVTAQVARPVDELLVAAPYFDQNALALGRLIGRLAPKSISVYTTSMTSVDGSRLAHALDNAGAHVSLYAYEPDEFTHAKLIGVVAGSLSWVFSGSANLSQAALNLFAFDGNVELAVLTSATPEQTRALFIPPAATARGLSIADLSDLTLEPSAEATALPVHLLRAAARPDGTVEVRCQPAPQVGWQLDDLYERSPLAVDGETAVTTGPLHGRLVRIVDDGGTVSRAPHNVRSCWRRLAGRPRAWQQGQPGQGGQRADCQFQVQQRRRNRAESVRDASGHHRRIADGKPGADRLRHGHPA
jgi:hypothetical protein